MLPEGKVVLAVLRRVGGSGDGVRAGSSSEVVVLEAA
jgi:hypothetical protein